MILARFSRKRVSLAPSASSAIGFVIVAVALLMASKVRAEGTEQVGTSRRDDSGTALVLTCQSWTPIIAQKLIEAGRENKRFLLDFRAAWCEPCTRFEKETLIAPDVTRALATRFVLLTVDVDQNRDVASACGVASLPDIRIADPEGHELARAHVFMDSAEFLHFLARTETLAVSHEPTGTAGAAFDPAHGGPVPPEKETRTADIAVTALWGAPVVIFAGVVLYFLAGYAVDPHGGGPVR